MPAHGKSLAAIEHPGPIDALIDLRGEILNFLVSKILPRRENAAQENRRINRGKFALLPARASLQVDEVEEKSMLVVQDVGEEAQRVANALANFRGLAVAAMIANAETGQAKSRGRDARHRSRIVAVREGAILHLASLGAGLIPEEIKADALDFIEQLLVGALERRAVGLHERRRGALLATREGHQWRGQQAHPADAHQFPSGQKSPLA